MNKKLKDILTGIALLAFAFVIPFLLGDFTFYIGFIPLNATVTSVVIGIFGVLTILGGILGK